ncbi:uncharacterized protein [Eleutherodactylus coqui]|uniref:uncharacterized protein n=1 Tax=Eleutherodactylus coqui TaxID=57060 RepID=UPI003462733B
MTEIENRMAVEAHIRTLTILHDALNKKGLLLAEPGRDYGLQAASIPLICPQLVEDLIQTLRQVEFLKYNPKQDEDGVGAIYPASSAQVIGLYKGFWKRHENLKNVSRPGALIKAAALILGYHDYDQSWLTAGLEEDGRLVLTANHICEAFEIWMGHKGKYMNDSYTCCGETSEHSVCELSDMRYFLHCKIDEEQKEIAENSRKATQKILFDAWNKGLIVDDGLLIRLQQAMETVPLITTSLLADLMKKLDMVTFKCDNKPKNEVLNAYPGDPEKSVMYLCPFFWKQSDQLWPGSRFGSLILCASQMLGYSHILETSSPKDPTGQQKWDPMTADDICAAFEHWMVHREPYVEGSYSCCGEENKYSVCRESLMGLQLRERLPEVQGLKAHGPRSEV